MKSIAAGIMFLFVALLIAIAIAFAGAIFAGAQLWLVRRRKNLVSAPLPLGDETRGCSHGGQPQVLQPRLISKGLS